MINLTYRIFKGVHEQRRGDVPTTKKIPHNFTNHEFTSIEEVLQDCAIETGIDTITLFRYLGQDIKQGNLPSHLQIYKERLQEVIDIDVLLFNKDTFMGNATKELTGDFYTPLVWAQESMNLFYEYYDLSLYTVWDISAGTGNLCLPYIGKCKQLFASTLYDDDVQILKERLPQGCVFQFDFLSSIDPLPLLPKELQQVLLNNEPLLIITNPPYSKKGSVSTAVHKHLKGSLDHRMKNDLMKQFIWQIGNLITLYNLTNTKLILVGTTSLFTKNAWSYTLRYINEHFHLRDGYFFKASEFAGIFDTIPWGVFTILYEPLPSIRLLTELKPTTLTIKERNLNTNEVSILGTHTLASHQTSSKLTMLEYLTKFPYHKVKQPILSAYGIPHRDENGLVRYQNGSPDAVCYFLTSGVLGMLAMYNGISPLPLLSIAYVVTKERFPDVIAAFVFSTYLHNKLGYYEAMDIWCLPDPSPEYTLWQQNAIVNALGHNKFFTYTLRDVDINGFSLTKSNNFFPFTREESQELITDPVKLQDLQDHYTTDNVWYVNLLRDCLPYVDSRVRRFYDVTMEVYKYLLQQPYNPEIPETGYWDIGLTQASKLGLVPSHFKDELFKAKRLSSQWFRENYKTHYDFKGGSR